MARFEAQARFCTTSSPLYHQLFTILGRRLSEDDDFADWLLTASGKRASFDVPLLLLAALHRKVLDHKPETRELAAWYPSVGGTQDAGAQALTQALKNSIDALRAELATFIAATRPGFDIDMARARIKESGLPFDVRYIQIPALAISSTNIRKRVARGMSVRYLTSESVLGYIRKRGLYTDLGQEDFE